MVGWLIRRIVRLLLLTLRLPFMAVAELSDRLSTRDVLLLKLRGEVADRGQGSALSPF